jgi:NTP pyrophosphatase (non-canonical NTP hydrolase)
MSENQYSIGDWAIRTFGRGEDPARYALRALEECLELCIASGVTKDEIGETVINTVQNNFEKLKAPRKELADTMVTLFVYAHVFGFSAFSEVDHVMGLNRQRAWRSNGDGTGQHIRR